MKTFYFLLFSLFITSQTYSQIIQKQVNISLGVQPCLSYEVMEIDNNETAKLWKKFFKDYGKVKKNRKAKEYYSTGVRVGRIKSGDPVDVYAKFVEFENGVEIVLCFDLGTEFLNNKTTPNEYEGAEELIQEFVVYVKKYVVGEKLKKEEGNLKDLEGNMKTTRKKNKKLHDKIDNYRENIVKAEDAIKENVLLQEELKVKIQDQASKLKEVQREMDNIGR